MKTLPKSLTWYWAREALRWYKTRSKLCRTGGGLRALNIVVTNKGPEVWGSCVIISSALRLAKANFTQQALVLPFRTVYTESNGEIITEPHKIWEKRLYRHCKRVYRYWPGLVKGKCRHNRLILNNFTRQDRSISLRLESWTTSSFLVRAFTRYV
jgi:hypothetical protein